MTFRFSSGTMDSMAGVFAPPKKYRLGTGGGSAKAPKVGGTMVGLAVASMVAKPTASSGGSRPSAQSKFAFGGGTRTRMSGRAVMTSERTGRRVAEVMVRITGRQHGGGHVLANFSYISRLGHGAEHELGLETSEGDVVRDAREMQLIAKEWHEAEMDGNARRKGATSISMILSMPTGTDPEKVKAAALEFARDEFANRPWVAALHVDRDHPHVHVTFARRDYDGRRFHPDRDDLFRYRQRFAEKLREQGIEANATPARARGIDPKHEHIAVQKMRDMGQVPRIDVSRAERAQRLRKQGITDPVEAVLASRQATVRATYVRSISELSTSPSVADQAVAQSLERFVATMPAPEANSARAMRESQEARAEKKPPEVEGSLKIGGPSADQAMSPLDRLRALRTKAEALDHASATSREEADAPGQVHSTQIAERLRTIRERAAAKPGEAQTEGITERIQTLLNETSDPPQAPDLGRAQDIVRQAQERDIARREHERDLDRDGPSR